MKKILLIVIIGAALGAALYGALRLVFAPSGGEGFDPANAAFLIESEEARLKDGQARVPSGAVAYAGYGAAGDLNSDGTDDYVFWVTSDGGGSGTFYYVVAALSGDSGYATTDAVFVGDRIQPEATSIGDGSGAFEITYLDRGENEPMSAAPTVRVTKTLRAVPEN